jgi:hypothetical protein
METGKTFLNMESRSGSYMGKMDNHGRNLDGIVIIGNTKCK